MAVPYLDIHTHLRKSSEDAVSVAVLSLAELRSGATPNRYRTAGIHPWWLEDLSPAELTELKPRIRRLAEEGALWGIGETGIDRAYPEFLEEQVELFHWHFDLAEEFQLPLVIHNVRSGSDFLGIMKHKRPTTAWVFHDFRGNEELIEQLLRLHPQTYFSFGLSIDNSQAIRDLLPNIPIGQVFLETDDQKHLDIHDIYLRASEKMGLDLDFLKSQLWLNFNKITTRTEQ
jgi:TatD DNase family protein